MKKLNEIKVYPVNDGMKKKVTKWDILNSSTENTIFFKSRIHELIFYFKNNINKFDPLLGIKPIHYYKTNRADELKKIYLSIFHSDTKMYLLDSFFSNNNLGNSKIESIESIDAKKELELIDFNKIGMDIELLFERVKGGLK